jgi:hypothetical protein
MVVDQLAVAVVEDQIEETMVVDQLAVAVVEDQIVETMVVDQLAVAVVENQIVGTILCHWLGIAVIQSRLNGYNLKILLEKRMMHFAELMNLSKISHHNLQQISDLMLYSFDNF